jgi:hypothetical protein
VAVSVSESVAPAEPAAREQAPRLPRWYRDRHGWIAAGIYTLAILYFDHGAVEHVASVCGCGGDGDPAQWMWLWAWIPFAIGHGLNPLLTHYIWGPGAFNLAAVALAPVTAIPGVPLTALFGPIVAFNLLLFAAPVINGWAAYRLCRYVSGAPWASVLVGYSYGFSDYELAHALGHMNLVWAFAPPLAVLLLLRLLNGEISRRRAAVALALLLLIQFGLSSEILFTMTFIGGVALLTAYVVGSPEDRRQLRGTVPVLVGAYGAVVIVWSYYIYLSFKVPPYAKGFGVAYPADPLSTVFPNVMFRVGGNRFAPLASTWGADLAEQNSYLGIPLVCIVAAYVASRWRTRGGKVLTVTMAVAFVLSLGDTLTIAGHPTFAMPFSWLAHLPLFDLIIPSRIALYVALGAAVAASVWISQARGRGRVWRWLLGLLAVAFLLPNLGLDGRETGFNDPAFFRTALYKEYLRRNEVVLPIPYAYAPGGESLLWQAQAHMYFKLASGDWGPVPPDFARIPVVGQLLSGTPTAQTPGYLNAFAASHDVSAVVVQTSAAGSWPGVLSAAHWRLAATAGGMEVWRRAGDLRPD